MNIRKAALVSIMMASPAFATGCSSASEPPPGTTVRGTYDAVADGPYAQMTFPDGEHFSLVRAACTSDCTESGTYAINAAATILALRDAKTGKIIELPFSALQSAPAAAEATMLAAQIRPLGSSLTTGSPGSVTSGQQTLVSDGGALSGDGGSLIFDGGSLISDGGSPMPGFNAGNQPFALGDSGSGAAGDSGSCPGCTSEPIGPGGSQFDAPNPFQQHDTGVCEGCTSEPIGPGGSQFDAPNPFGH
jgi:hypothetical protein